MDSKDRLNPGRAYYRCGNFGLGATCSFFAWVTVSIVAPPAASPAKPTEMKTSPLVGRHTPERKVSALTVALKATTKAKSGSHLLPAECLQQQTGYDKEELEKLFGKKKKRTRTKSQGSKKSVGEKALDEVGIVSPVKEVPNPEPEEMICSPYYSSTTPISIPKRDERIFRVDVLNELDRQQMLKRNGQNERRPSTYPKDMPRRRMSFSNEDEIEVMDQQHEEREEEFYLFPCMPSLACESPALILRRETRDVELMVEERG